jgi:hypothetical protein
LRAGQPGAGIAARGPAELRPWALQTALPWIVIGAVFGWLRSRIPGNGGDVIRSGLSIAAVVFGIAAFALLGEPLVRALTGAADVFLFLCERAAASIAVISLLVAMLLATVRGNGSGRQCGQQHRREAGARRQRRFRRRHRRFPSGSR